MASGVLNAQHEAAKAALATAAKAVGNLSDLVAVAAPQSVACWLTEELVALRLAEKLSNLDPSAINN